MNPLDRKLYQYLASKELTFGCVLLVKDDSGNEEVRFVCQDDIGGGHTLMSFDSREWSILDAQVPYDYEILGSTPGIAEVHRWLIANGFTFRQTDSEIVVLKLDVTDENAMKNFIFDPSGFGKTIPYPSSIHLMEQSDETKEALITLFKSVGTEK